jgi:hypothetical protein
MHKKPVRERNSAWQFGKTFRRALTAACLISPAFAATAWDGVVNGKVARLDAVGGSGGAPGNYDMRVILDNPSAVCAGAVDSSWGYINSNDANYKGVMALLLTAYTAGKTVALYTTKSSAGYCQIGYVSISG